VNGREAARSGEWAQHFSNASCFTTSQETGCEEHLEMNELVSSVIKKTLAHTHSQQSTCIDTKTVGENIALQWSPSDNIHVSTEQLINSHNVNVRNIIPAHVDTTYHQRRDRIDNVVAIARANDNITKRGCTSRLGGYSIRRIWIRIPKM